MYSSGWINLIRTAINRVSLGHPTPMREKESDRYSRAMHTRVGLLLSSSGGVQYDPGVQCRPLVPFQSIDDHVVAGFGCEFRHGLATITWEWGGGTCGGLHVTKLLILPSVVTEIISWGAG